MSLLKHNLRIEKLDYLIRHKLTGNFSECAKKLEVSRRQLYNIVEELNEVGIPIVYSKKKKYFEYELEGELTIMGFHKKQISESELEKIRGGNSFFVEEKQFCEILFRTLGYNLSFVNGR